jgi:hypothetical protein
MCPTRIDVHDTDVIFVDEPDEIINPLGIKGLGEIGIVVLRQQSPTWSITRRASAYATYRSRSIHYTKGSGPRERRIYEHLDGSDLARQARQHGP